jgi:hypothetical protein
MASIAARMARSIAAPWGMLEDGIAVVLIYGLIGGGSSTSALVGGASLIALHVPTEPRRQPIGQPLLQPIRSIEFSLEPEASPQFQPPRKPLPELHCVWPVWLRVQ